MGNNLYINGVNSFYMPIGGYEYSTCSPYPNIDFSFANFVQPMMYPQRSMNIPSFAYTLGSTLIRLYDFISGIFSKGEKMVKSPKPEHSYTNLNLLDYTSNRREVTYSPKSSARPAQSHTKESQTAGTHSTASMTASRHSYLPVTHVELEAPSINTVPESFVDKYGVKERELPDGTKVLACRWSKFDKCQPEWIELQHAMLRAADDLGLTLVYSDVTRTVAASNAGHAKKGDLVLPGGESPHNYGVAADIRLFKDGKSVYEKSELQTAFARRAQEYSNGRIEWGGDWTKEGERHHFNIKGWRSTYKKSEYLVG